jgi:hypothetical protein
MLSFMFELFIEISFRYIHKTTYNLFKIVVCVWMPYCQRDQLLMLSNFLGPQVTAFHNKPEHLAFPA